MTIRCAVSYVILIASPVHIKVVCIFPYYGGRAGSRGCVFRLILAGPCIRSVARLSFVITDSWFIILLPAPSLVTFLRTIAFLVQ